MAKIIDIEKYQDRVIECEGYTFTFKANQKESFKDEIRMMELIEILDHPERCKSREEYIRYLDEMKAIRKKWN